MNTKQDTLNRSCQALKDIIEENGLDVDLFFEVKNGVCTLSTLGIIFFSGLAVIGLEYLQKNVVEL